ncbi:TraI domain-containing protein [Legionella birminghamensis]|uniref:TraI domain-containing protein n=1 Tax=Legionella birminghamensis TaxID=28083 RepID=UPI0015596FE5|nr:TraI domain-containing protein [Legionella birminghamensis]
MFHRYGKGRVSQARPLKDLTKIITVEQILAEEKRNQLLQQITENCALEPARFDSICTTLIHNLVNHTQLLPETSNSYYSQPGGLIDHALNRTEAALNLFKQYLIVEENVSYSEEQKLWQYALLSAALLQGIGKLQIDLTVELFDNHGQFLKQWNPLLENLILVGSHYSYSFQKESDIEFRKRLNLLMARLLMPSSGFAWIASNPEVLQVWLALLNEDVYSAGTLGAILIRADAIALQRYFNQQAARHYGNRGRYGRVSTFGGTPDSVSDIEQQIGIEFLQWLQKSLDSGIIMINKAPLLMVPGGLLMCPEIFQLFVREHPEYKNWQAIQNAFLSLGLHRKGPDATSLRFEHGKTQKIFVGLVVEGNGSSVMPPEVTAINLNTGSQSRISSMELIHQAQYNNVFTQQNQVAVNAPLQHLSAKGWQNPAQPVLTNQQSLLPG